MGRLRLFGIFIFCLALGARPAAAVTQAFFSSQESVEKELAWLIDESRVSIDIALFHFSSRPLAQALSRAHARGVHIRIVIDGHKEAGQGASALETVLASGDVRRLDGRQGGVQGLMHHKFALFDKKRLVTGSFNWTAGAEHINYENALLLDDPRAVRAYEQEFERLWNLATPMPPDPSGLKPKKHGSGYKRNSGYNRPLKLTLHSTTKKKRRSKTKKT